MEALEKLATRLGLSLPESKQNQPSIDKYIYLTAHRYFEADKSLLKYSKTEIVESPKQIEHPILRNKSVSIIDTSNKLVILCRAGRLKKNRYQVIYDQVHFVFMKIIDKFNDLIN